MSNEAEEKEFLAEAEVMDLSPIKQLTFGVAVASGRPDQVKFLCTTFHGPYDFTEMAQEVGQMWVTHQHHAKVIVLEKDPTKKVQCLDANTVDYIEAHYTDIIMEEVLASTEEKKYTCVAGVVQEEEAEAKP